MAGASELESRPSSGSNAFSQRSGVQETKPVFCSRQKYANSSNNGWNLMSGTCLMSCGMVSNN